MTKTSSAQPSTVAPSLAGADLGREIFAQVRVHPVRTEGQEAVDAELDEL